MIRTGDVIRNPVTGEQLRFVKTARDTGGEAVVVEVTVEPRGFVAAAHIHPRQEERFEVLSGRARFRIGEREATAGPGDVLIVPAGTPHSWWNAGDEETRVIVEFRPALRTEGFFETFFGLARDGKLDKRGWPGVLRAAVLGREYRHEVAIAPQKEILLSRLPPPVIRLLLPLVALLGRLLGYRGSDQQYSAE
jgi:quercetin dioxygenase-like cupin family protein